MTSREYSLESMKKWLLRRRSGTSSERQGFQLERRRYDGHSCRIYVPAIKLGKCAAPFISGTKDTLDPAS